ncbi:hemolysin family protein [Agrococcus jejuensis]|uniref:hemolysin family protein n=1 Tax=Agrococcus jejuensis TaxID=399736 RepID=UPI00119F6749|nr:hemolysin family protein [Agrococcus jejuensis]
MIEQLPWLFILIGVVLTVGTGYFVASEFSLVNLDRSELEAQQERGEGSHPGVIAALKQTSTHLSSAQLGITLTTLLTGYTMEPAISHLLAPVLEGWGIPDEIAPGISLAIAIVIATLLSMIVGELVPKNFALAVPLRTAKIVTPFQRAFTFVMKPAVLLLNGSANGILRSIGIEPKEELSGARTADELSSLVRRSAMEGLLDADQATLLSRTLRFSELTAGDVMTPRPRVEAIDRERTVADVLELSRTTGLSRFPVIDDDLDRVVGIAHVKQAVSVPRDRRADVPVLAIAEEPHRVPETVGLPQLLADLKERGYQMAIVVDEYGGTAGLATLEDLVEEMVGEVSDEHDRLRPEIVRAPGWVAFPGLLRPDELRERAAVEIPDDGPYETVAGYVVAELGRLPVVGDEVAIDGGVLRVERLDGRRIDRIRYVVRTESEEVAR